MKAATKSSHPIRRSRVTHATVSQSRKARLRAKVLEEFHCERVPVDIFSDVMQWLGGEPGRPKNFDHVIRTLGF